MGYRIGEPRPRPRRRDVQDTATPMKIYVQNWCTARIAIPCWYEEVVRPVPAHLHDRAMHDHVGWPSPNYPDHVCQDSDFASEEHRHRLAVAYDAGHVHPIHLTQEGYTEVSVHVGATDAGSIDVSGSIDDRDDWVVRLNIQPRLKRTEEPVEVDLTAYVSNQTEHRTDLVCLATLVVLPALGTIGSR